MTITPTGRNPLRKANVKYIQLYLPSKEVFVAGTLPPFADNNLELLGVDRQLHDAIAHAGGGRRSTVQDLITAYNHSKERCHTQLLQFNRQSFGVREEFRLPLDLLKVMNSLYEHENGPTTWQSQYSAAEEQPFLIFRSQLIQQYLQTQLGKFCFGYEKSLSMQNQTGLVRIELTVMSTMFLRILRRYLLGEHLARETCLWKDVSKARNQAVKGLHGLDFEESSRRYSYCWLPPKFDWTRWIFEPKYTYDTLFSNNYLMTIYRRRWLEVQRVSKEFHNIDILFQLLRENKDLLSSWTPFGSSPYPFQRRSAIDLTRLTILYIVTEYISRAFRQEMFRITEDDWREFRDHSRPSYTANKIQTRQDVFILAKEGRLPLSYTE